MKIITKKVYYCDYCKKHSLRDISKHERHCTLNPDRSCRLCGGHDIRKLLPRFERKDVKVTDIAEAVEHCPNCILTVLRCNELHFYPVQFDYKQSLQEWWDDKNKENRE